MMKAEPQKEHQWLHKLIGEWTSEVEATMEPGKPRETSKGTESVRSLGGLWILAEGQGEMPGGGPATMLMTLGYDPRKQRYVGTWIGSMMTHLWVYDGSLDAAGRVLTLEAEGPDMAGQGKTAKYREVIEFKTDDHRVPTSQMLGDDGKWHQFMTALPAEEVPPWERRVRRSRSSSKRRSGTQLATLEKLSDTDWRKVTGAEKWPVGVTAHLSFAKNSSGGQAVDLWLLQGQSPLHD